MSLPEFGEPTVMPLVARNTYEARTDALMALGAKAGFDAFAVHGDREHAANVANLSGYDPRFEETLLVIVPVKQPRLLVGNEGWGYAEIRDGPYERVLPDLLTAGATIPATGSDHFTTNIEDGIALADDALREEIAARYPEAWSRIEARRAFMSDVLGIRLKPEVLPSPTFRLSFRHFGFRATLR